MFCINPIKVSIIITNVFLDEKKVHKHTNFTFKTPETYGNDEVFAWIPAAVVPEIVEQPGEMGKVIITFYI